MNILKETVILVVCFSAYVNGEEDVYWRPWKDQMPEDAIVAGEAQTECGATVPFYLAQTFSTGYSGGAFPGKMFKFSHSIKTTYAGGQMENDNLLKVLCAKDSSIVAWTPASQLGKLNNVENDCVIAGVEPSRGHSYSNNGGDYLFFGKAYYKGDIVIGKVRSKIPQGVGSYPYPVEYASARGFSESVSAQRGDAISEESANRRGGASYGGSAGRPVPMHERFAQSTGAIPEGFSHRSQGFTKRDVSVAPSGDTEINWVMYFPLTGKEQFLENEFEVLCYKAALSKSKGEASNATS